MDWLESAVLPSFITKGIAWQVFDITIKTLVSTFPSHIRAAPVLEPGFKSQLGKTLEDGDVSSCDLTNTTAVGYLDGTPNFCTNCGHLNSEPADWGHSCLFSLFLLKIYCLKGRVAETERDKEEEVFPTTGLLLR